MPYTTSTTISIQQSASPHQPIWNRDDPFLNFKEGIKIKHKIYILKANSTNQLNLKISRRSLQKVVVTLFYFSAPLCSDVVGVAGDMTHVRVSSGDSHVTTLTPSGTVTVPHDPVAAGVSHGGDSMVLDLHA